MSEVLSESDVAAIKAYNAEIDKGVTSQTAFNRTMLNTSREAQNVVAAANGGKVAIDGLTKSSKAAQLGMNLLSTAINIGITFVVAEAIQFVYQFITAQKQLQKAAAETGSAFAEKAKDIDRYNKKS